VGHSRKGGSSGVGRIHSLWLTCYLKILFASPKPRPKFLAFDHVTPDPSHTLNTPPITAILYASIGSEHLYTLHSFLHALATAPNPTLEYVVRYVPPYEDSSARNWLAGYGVNLDLKKMDYLSIDDRQANEAGMTCQFRQRMSADPF
jgi:hypothetical protein